MRRCLSWESDHRVSELKKHCGLRADVTQQPDVPRRHQRLSQRKALRSQSISRRKQPQHRRYPRSVFLHRLYLQYQNFHRRRLCLHRSRNQRSMDRKCSMWSRSRHKVYVHLLWILLNELQNWHMVKIYNSCQYHV